MLEVAMNTKQEALWATLIRAETVDICHHVKGIGFLTMESFPERLFTSVCGVKAERKLNI